MENPGSLYTDPDTKANYFHWRLEGYHRNDNRDEWEENVSNRARQKVEEAIQIDYDIEPNRRTYHWSVSFNDKRNAAYASPHFVFALPKALGHAKDITIQYLYEDGTQRDIVKDIQHEDWTKSSSTWGGEIFEDESSIADKQAYYFRGKDNENTEKTINPPVPRAATDEIGVIYKMLGAGSGANTKKEGIKVWFTTEVQPGVDIPEQMHVLAALKSREGEGTLSARTAYYWKIVDKVMNYKKLPDVLYCYNRSYADAPYDQYAHHEVGREDFTSPLVLAPAYSRDKDLVEWVMWMGYPHDNADLWTSFLDEAEDAVDYHVGGLNPVNAYYLATQNAIWHETDGVSLIETNLNHSNPSNPALIIKNQYPLSQKIYDAAVKAKNEYGTLKNYLDANEDLGKYNSYYYDNNQAREVNGKLYQNYVALRYATDVAPLDYQPVVKLKKVNADKQPLTGAAFTLLDGAYYSFEEAFNVALKNGPEVIFRDQEIDTSGGLSFPTDLVPDHEYTLVETKSPEGYVAEDPTVFKIQRVYRVSKPIIPDPEVTGVMTDFTLIDGRHEHATDSYRIAISKLITDKGSPEYGLRKWVSESHPVVEPKQIEPEQPKVLDLGALEVVNNKALPLNIAKVNSVTNATLSGAKLKLVQGGPDSSVTVAEWDTTNQDKTVDIAQNTEYTLIETEAPKGFKLAKPITFKALDEKRLILVDKDNNRIIENPHGMRLVMSDVPSDNSVISTSVHVDNRYSSSAQAVTISYPAATAKELDGSTRKFVVADKVDYFGLKPGLKYQITSELYRVSDEFEAMGAPVLTENTDYTPTEADGQVTIQFSQPLELVPGVRYVVTQKFVSEADPEGKTHQLTHDNLRERSQTFVVEDKSGDVPEDKTFGGNISTLIRSEGASSTDSQPLTVTNEDVKTKELFDDIGYSGLVAGAKYSVETEIFKVLTSGETQKVSGFTSEFTPEQSSGIYPVRIPNSELVNLSISSPEEPRYVVTQKVESVDEVVDLPKGGKSKQTLIHRAYTDLKESFVIDKAKPSLKTTVTVNGQSSSADAAVEVQPNPTVLVTDLVEYTALEAGQAYWLQGELHQVGANGETTLVKRVVTEFTPADSKGTHTVDFGSVEGLLSDQKYVVFETAALKSDVTVAEGADGLGRELQLNDVAAEKIVRHADVDDVAQTFVLRYPDSGRGSLATTVEVAGKSSGLDAPVEVSVEDGVAGVVVKDRVSYRDLVAGAEYTLQGSLVRVLDGGRTEVVKEVDGHVFVASETGSGSEVVDFGTVTGLVPGGKYVVFETATSSAEVVAGVDGVPVKHVVRHADVDDVAQTFIVPDKPVTPENPENPDNPDKPGDPEKPNTPEKPDNPDKPATPENPDNPDNPDKPVTPENPENPDNPGNPEKPNTPEKPDNPGDPEKPNTPEKPDNPGNPEKPNTPEKPDVPLLSKTGTSSSTVAGIAVLMLAIGGIGFYLSARLRGSSLNH